MRAGEVVALVGHNGAGKTTLVELLSGALRRDAGEIRVNGRAVALRSPRDAQLAGIATLHQHLALADNLDVTANVFLGHELRTRSGSARRARHGARGARAARHGSRRVSPRCASRSRGSRAGSASSSRSRARCGSTRRCSCSWTSRPPRSAPASAGASSSSCGGCAPTQLAILLVSHDLETALAVAQRVAVMRRGRLVAMRARAELDAASLAALVVG